MCNLRFKVFPRKEGLKLCFPLLNVRSTGKVLEFTFKFISLTMHTYKQKKKEMHKKAFLKAGVKFFFQFY